MSTISREICHSGTYGQSLAALILRLCKLLANTNKPGAYRVQDDEQSDVWSEWLLHHRHGGDPDVESLIRGKLEHLADRVIDAARLKPGMVLADIGSGDGLVAFRAIERLGPSLQVLLTDVSAPMLQHAREIAEVRGILPQCNFYRCSAENLSEVESASIDVVTTRAVLAYVDDKAAAFREFKRVLKKGGRISILEPVLQDDALAVNNLRESLASLTDEHQQKFAILLHRWKSIQYPDTLDKILQSPLTSYSERDLVRFAQEAGFEEIHMEFHIDVTRSDPLSWAVSLESSPHPLAPSLRKIMAEHFTSDERDFFEDAVRPFTSTASSGATRVAYLTAT